MDSVGPTVQTDGTEKQTFVIIEKIFPRDNQQNKQMLFKVLSMPAITPPYV